MQELVGRVSALDSEAGAAVRAIAYFDELVRSRAGLESIVRGAAILAGCPTRMLDTERSLRIRVREDGVRQDLPGNPDEEWPARPVGSGAAVLWLERTGPADPVAAIVLERAASAARDVLDRVWGRACAPPPADPALVEVLLDRDASRQARLLAARRLGLPADALVRAVAVEGCAAEILSAGEAPHPSSDTGPQLAEGPTDERRRGIGPAVPILDLPGSWRLARIALRLTAEGGEQDPGPRVVHADELGGLALFADTAPGTTEIPDVLALDRAAAAAPWMLRTLHTFACAPSLREAAAGLSLHRSTLQERLVRAEHLLGWNVRAPQGRFRLHLALALRRLRGSEPSDTPRTGAV